MNNTQIIHFKHIQFSLKIIYSADPWECLLYIDSISVECYGCLDTQIQRHFPCEYLVINRLRKKTKRCIILQNGCVCSHVHNEELLVCAYTVSLYWRS